MTERIANGRFTVVFGDTALQEARTAGISLPALTARALSHINALLPGPKTTITINYAGSADLIPQIGINGFTNPVTGHMTIAFGATRQISPAKALTLWLPRDLAHEVDHSVRSVGGGTGFGPTLLPRIISEGVATVFDETAFPGPPDPWARAITPTQECISWRKAQSQLGDTGLYEQWMFGGHGIPHWAAFTIGYHIVNDYRRSHPNVSWEILTGTGCIHRPFRKPLPALLAMSKNHENAQPIKAVAPVTRNVRRSGQVKIASISARCARTQS